MTDDEPTLPLPAVPAVLALAGLLRPLAAPAHPLHATLSQAIAARVDELLAGLGIPGRLALALENGEASGVPGPLLGLAVNGQACSPAGETATRLWGRLAAAGAGDLAFDLLIDLCLEILKDQPEALLELPQAEIVAAEWPRPRRRKGSSAPDWPDPFELASVLRALRLPLSLGISIADRQAAARVIADNAPLWNAPEDLGELLAGALASPTIAIRLPPARFRELTLAWQEKGGEAFGQMRFDLAKELGWNLPPFVFQTDVDLKAEEFAFRFQYIPGLPFTGLTLDHLVATLADEIRRQLPRLVVASRVEAQLELVEDELRDMVVECIPLPRLTRELRQRAREAGGLRRLPLILEELLDAPFAAAGAALALK